MEDRPVQPEGYRLLAADTPYVAERTWLEGLRALSWEERVDVLRDTLATVHELSRLGLRARHPEASERELWLREAALRLDPQTMRRFYGWDPEASG